MSSSPAQTKKRELKTQSATQEFLSGKLNQVDIAGIEKELKRLWTSAAREDSDRAANSVTRACVMNLILFSDAQDAEKSAGDLLDDIMLRHPCRAILAISRESSNRNLEAWVSARCHIGDAKMMSQICCEQITVRGESVSARELSSVVLPLILPDLPVFMWWNVSRLDPEKMTPFIGSVDRFIVDSACDDDNLKFFSAVLKLMSDSTAAPCVGQTVCSDLNWRRSVAWRESIALAFDARQGDLSPSYLSGIDTVEIRYGAGGDNSGLGLINQSLLVVGWLASTLGWRLQTAAVKDKQTIELGFDASGTKLLVSLIPVTADEAARGDIGSIQIHSKKPEEVTIFASQQPDNPGIGVNCLRGPSSSQARSSGTSMFELDEMPEGQLIDKELEALACEPVFKRAVASTVEILTLLQEQGGKK